MRRTDRGGVFVNGAPHGNYTVERGLGQAVVVVRRQVASPGAPPVNVSLAHPRSTSRWRTAMGFGCKEGRDRSSFTVVAAGCRRRGVQRCASVKMRWHVLELRR